MESEIRIAIDLAKKVTAIARGKMGTYKGATYSKLAHDWEYAVDVAENKIKSIKKYGYGYVAEGVPLFIPKGCEFVFICDMDGSRPAQINLDPCAFTIGIARYMGDVPTFNDLVAGVVRPLKEEKTFYVVRGSGEAYELSDSGKKKRIRPSPILDLKHAMVNFEMFSMRPGDIGLTFEYLSTEEINAPFVFQGAAYGILGVARGQFQAFVDPRIRICEELSLPKPRKVLFPYDIAGSIVILEEAGGVHTDAYGKSLKDRKLWAFREEDNQQVWSEECFISCIAANNRQIHEQILERIERGMKLLKDIYPTLEERRLKHQKS